MKEYLKIYKEGLLNDILPFWINHSVDREYGGFMFCLNRDGSIIDTDKGVWQIGRFTWMLATLYNEVEPREEWLELAKHGASFLSKHCFDTDGRMFFLVTREGNPLRKRRYVFSESFAAIAYAALYKATGEPEYNHRARSCFDIYWKYMNTPGLITPKYAENRKMKTIGGPMIGIVTAQELRKNLGDESYTKLISDWINEIERDFVRHDLKLVMETVGPNGEFIDHFDGRTLNPGHAIEGAWFIMEEAIFRGKDKVLSVIGTKMFDYMWEKGWDKEYGGITYFKDAKGLPVQEYWHDMKFWWPQNEALIATILAFYLTKDKKYVDWHKMIHDYSFNNFSDPEYGEWFGYLHRDGRVSVPIKGNLWKGCFHVPRMYLKAWKFLEIMESEKFLQSGNKIS